MKRKIITKASFFISLIFLSSIFIILLSIPISCYSNDSKTDLENIVYIYFDLNSNKAIYKQEKEMNLKPGSNGDINIIIDNNKNNKELSLNFIEEINKPKNLKFEFDNKEFNSLIDLNEELRKLERRIIRIKYKWNYETGSSKGEIEQNDIIDTNDSKKTYFFTILLNEYEKENKYSIMPRTGFFNNEFNSNKLNNYSLLYNLSYILFSIGIILILIIILGLIRKVNKK